MSKIKLHCIVCGKGFLCWPIEIKRGRKFCSNKCSYDGYKMNPEALERARQRIIKRNKEHPISSEQGKINLSKRKIPPIRGKDHYRWKGGMRKTSDGRIRILVPGHPFADGKGYVMRSRSVMEKKIGRYLLPKEVVHHINGSKKDDRPENLRLFSNTGKHTKLHHQQGDIRKGICTSP